eukprot:s2297_g2.t1
MTWQFKVTINGDSEEPEQVPARRSLFDEPPEVEAREVEEEKVDDMTDAILEKIRLHYSNLRTAFRALDRSNNGYISRADFLDALEHIFINSGCTPEEIDEIAGRFGFGEGCSETLSYEEFCQVAGEVEADPYQETMQGVEVAREDRSDRQRIEEIHLAIQAFRQICDRRYASLRESFRALDKSRKSALSPAEFAQGLSMHGVNLKPEEMQLFFFGLHRGGPQPLAKKSSATGPLPAASTVVSPLLEPFPWNRNAILVRLTQMASFNSGIQEFEHCFSPKRRNKSSFPEMTSPDCRASRDDDCSTCAPSPAFSSGYPSPLPSLPISKFGATDSWSAARPQELFGDDNLFWGSLGFGNFRRPETDSRHIQDSFAPVIEEDDGFQTPRVARELTTPPGAPKKAAAPPLMKVLQANTDSADTCRALRALLIEDPEVPRFPFFEHFMEPPLVCAAKAFCSAEVMRLLIQHGADVNLRDSMGHSAADIISQRLESMALHEIHHPAKVTDQEALKVLKDAGAELPRTQSLFEKCDRFFCAPMAAPSNLEEMALWLR